MYFGHSYVSLSLIIGKRNDAIIHEAQHILFEVDQSFKHDFELYCVLNGHVFHACLFRLVVGIPLQHF
ncbi:MAG: hypothetical protein ACI9Y1_000356 [Lentisphaeria bacterium]|jgi:hypothetical protein